jgi:hypothetical protein
MDKSLWDGEEIKTLKRNKRLQKTSKLLLLPTRWAVQQAQRKSLSALLENPLKLSLYLI